MEYKVRDFLDAALYNDKIIFVTNRVEIEETTVVGVGNKYDNCTFSVWDIYHGTIRLFLD